MGNKSECLIQRITKIVHKLNQQPPLKEVVCKPRPIGAYGAAKAANKRNILKAKPHPITATKGGGFSSSKRGTRHPGCLSVGNALADSMRMDNDIDLGLIPEPSCELSSLELADLSAVLSYDMRRTVDLGVISFKNMVYAREALLKGRLIYTKNRYRADLYRANLLGMYLQYNQDRQEVVNAYRTG